MTLEEAAEIVLKGDPWMKCPKSEDQDHPQDCECDLSGAVLKPEYKEACRVLDRPLPPIWTRTEMANGGYRVSGPVVSMGKFPMMMRLVPIGGTLPGQKR